jgi:hypothetical protein
MNKIGQAIIDFVKLSSSQIKDGLFIIIILWLLYTNKIDKDVASSTVSRERKNDTEAIKYLREKVEEKDSMLDVFYKGEKTPLRLLEKRLDSILLDIKIKSIK